MTSSTVQLAPHPGTPAGWDFDVSVEYALKQDQLLLSYCLHGDMAQLRLPPPTNPARVDGLWAHSCFEVFLRGENEDSYSEFNFSPSGEWAHYQFDRYRGEPNRPDYALPDIERVIKAGSLQLKTHINLPSLRPVHIGFSAVLENTRGELSYWALHHPSAQPDFHDPDSFTLLLE